MARTPAHQLIASTRGALLERLIDALRDIRGLAIERRHHRAGVGVETLQRVVIADQADRLARDRGNVKWRGR